MLRRVLSASVGTMALAGPAFAADLAPPPVYVPPPPMWTGFYVGVNAGYEWSATQNVNIVSVPVITDPVGIVAGVSGLANVNVHAQSNGFIGGGQIGYNYQFGNGWLAGLEADIDGVADANGSGRLATFGTIDTVPVTSALDASKSLDYLGTVRGRFGFLLLPTLLIYGDGGLAYGEFSMAADAIQSASENGFLGAGTRTINYTKAGWTAGGGLEWMVFPNWSFKAEYLYCDLGKVTSADALFAVSSAGPVTGVYAASQNRTHLNGNIIRAGINYHFNWGDPAAVVAKY